ncbi:hypothetical protein F5Y02DRAFT_144300 [Annulohypoxylon stygium]|nr:hypothetical protein F5Y02DRAFT_144300 [Annulohypoxylon stygium]
MCINTKVSRAFNKSVVTPLTSSENTQRASSSISSTYLFHSPAVPEVSTPYHPTTKMQFLKLSLTLLSALLSTTAAATLPHHRPQQHLIPPGSPNPSSGSHRQRRGDKMRGRLTLAHLLQLYEGQREPAVYPHDGRAQQAHVPAAVGDHLWYVLDTYLGPRRLNACMDANANYVPSSQGCLSGLSRLGSLWDDAVRLSTKLKWR